MKTEGTFDLKAALKQTGVSVRTFKRIARLAIELQDALARNGLVLFCGSSNDDAALAHRETGILLGAFSEPVWMGGDWNERQSSSGVRYNPYLSPTAGQFAEESAANGMPHDEAEARCEAVTGDREGQVPTSAAVEQSEPRPEAAPGGDGKISSAISAMLSEFHESWMNEDDKREFETMALNALGVSRQSMVAQIEEGIANGWALETQIKIARKVIEKLK